MKINSHTQNQGGEVCLVMEEGAKFHPRQEEKQHRKPNLSPERKPEKNEEQALNDGRRLTWWTV